MEDLYLLTSSMTRFDENDHQVVMVGPRKELETLAHQFGVKSWTVGDGVRTANDGRIRLQPVRTWGMK
jgi:hypothetical protein